MISAKIVADSIGPMGDRLTSFVITFPRIILAELNTHRMLSKNSASSRAIPFNKMVESVQNNPFIPIAWQKEHKGMQGTEYITDKDTLRFIEEQYLKGRNNSLETAKILNASICGNVTKQLCNRLLEPFMWHTVLITGGEEGLQNFFDLRCPQYHSPVDTHFRHKSKKDCIAAHSAPKNLEIFNNFTVVDWLKINEGQAEIHMMELSEKMYDAYNSSTPINLHPGAWHLPFREQINTLDLQNYIDSNRSFEDLMVMVATAMAARVSYTVIGEEKEFGYEKQLELYDRLINQKPMHCFTENTEILTNEGWKYFEDLNKSELFASVDVKTGEFIGFEKATNFIEDDYEGKVYTYKTNNIDISVTPNHKLLGISVSKYLDRARDYDTLEIIEPQYKVSEVKTLGEREMIMFSAPKEVIVKDFKAYKEGQLLGFFLGDGTTRSKNYIMFRLKKERKRLYIINILKELGINYTVRLDKYNVFNIKAFIGDYTIYYDSDINKRIPESILEGIIHKVDFIAGLFDGFKNSDGSVKRNTWVYDTYSTQLRDNILFLCPLIGLTGIENPSYNHHRISFLTTNRILLNDPRKINSKVTIEDYKGKIYCVETPSHGIIVRKNGKTLITHNSSPFEHSARVMDEDEYNTWTRGRGINDWVNEIIYDDNAKGWCKNYKGFIQLRQILEDAKRND